MKTLWWVIGIIIIIILGWFIFSYVGVGAPPVQTSTTPIATATFMCDNGKNIMAAFYEGSSTPAATPNEPPTPGGSVALTLSDQRTMTLAQTISADGARYASADGSIVFWNKGNGVTFTENGQPSYTGCISVVADPGQLPQAYENGTEGFSIRIPSGYTPDATYTYQELGPGKDIGGVKFTIDPSIATGTNLASDSYVSVEEISQTANCSATLFLDQGAKAMTMTDIGTTYSVASSTGAGAGNRYEETVYALPGTNPCVAVRYFIHYGVLENYPAGTVQQFNEASLLTQFDSIRRTLTIGQ